MSTEQPGNIDQKYSVYVALGIAGAIAIYDIAVNQSVEASKEIVLAFVAFAGLRQAAKTFLKR